MGKPTGFLDYPREPIHDRPPEERVRDWKEMHLPIAEQTLREQGGRCMDCGVPFCHTGKLIGGMASGCPVHNFIPEWNDLVWRGNWKEAWIRLAKTNNFPEFTGRVCPAPCEGSCTVAIDLPAVNIKMIEEAIADRAFAEGWVVPNPPAVRTGKRVAIVGSGPAGLAAAAQINRAGHEVVVFERDDRVGGLLMYGIPNMKLDKKLVERRVRLMAEEGVRFVTGTEVGKDLPAAQLLRDFEAVVLCGGAINSPQTLQVSGVGNAAELEALGIAVVHDLAAVGENLQDHLEVYVQHESTQPVSMQPALKKWKRPYIGARWLFFRDGPGASNHFEAGGFARSNDEVAYPNLMFHFLPLAIRYDGSAPAAAHGYQVHVGPMYSDARGSVKIVSADPRTKPALRFNYLSTEQDRREWVEAIKVARSILDRPAFDPYNAGETSPGPAVQSEEEVLDWVARDAETALHPSCTCAMGSVVDPGTMRVHGLDGLRVVDASVFPFVPNGNIYAPVMMVAEKAADLIRENTPLEPIRAEFYRHAERTASR